MGFVGINSNDPDNYPTDNWEHMIKRAETMSYPYLHDASQEVARGWGAERTPEFYLINGQGGLRIEAASMILQKTRPCHHP